MIYDFNENWKIYSGGKQKIWRQAFKFINSASLEISEGRHNIDGEKIFAVVSSYETRSLHESKVEMHREFIDLQTLLSGREIIFYNPLPTLKRSGKFNSAKDCGFYEHNMKTAVPLPLTPEFFTVFFPEEGHMPCVCFSETPEPVKKIVIKIHRSLLI